MNSARVTEEHSWSQYVLWFNYARFSLIEYGEVKIGEMALRGNGAWEKSFHQIYTTPFQPLSHVWTARSFYRDACVSVWE